MLPPSQVENDSKDEHMQDAGIVIPPPDIKSWADASARFMASVIPRFEKRIIADNAGKAQYSFLNDTDPYHAYYQRQLSELRALNGVPDEGTYPKLKPLIAEATGDYKKGTTSFDDWLVEARNRCAERIFKPKTVASPITGELIPADQMYEHLQDPKFKEQKDSLFAKISRTRTAAQDDKLSSFVAWLALSHPDIFGTKEEEFVSAVMAQIPGPRLPGLSAAAVVPPFSSDVMLPVDDMSQHMQDPNDVSGTTKEESSVAVKTEIQNPELSLDRLESSLFSVDAQCLTPPNMMDRSGSQQTPLPSLCMPPPPQKPEPKPVLDLDGHTAIPAEDEVTDPSNVPSWMKRKIGQFMSVSPPPAMPQGTPEDTEPKRQRLPVSLLVPEDQFLAQHPGPVSIGVLVPEARQRLEIRVESLSESVNSFKEKIAGKIGVPADKLKLSGKAGFFKDNLSLAYYNVAVGEMLSLSRS